MEFKARINQIPAILLTDERFLHLDTTFKLFGDGVRALEYSARPMLEQMIAGTVSGAGKVLHGSYDLSVVIGDLFDINQSERELKRTFEQVVGWDVWFAASYSCGQLTFTFSRELWSSYVSGMYVYEIDISEAHEGFSPTSLGQKLLKACLEVVDTDGIAIKHERVFTVAVKEEQLPETLQKLNALFHPLLPKSGHTVTWLGESENQGYSLPAIPPK